MEAEVEGALAAVQAEILAAAVEAASAGAQAEISVDLVEVDTIEEAGVVRIEVAGAEDHGVLDANGAAAVLGRASAGLDVHIMVAVEEAARVVWVALCQSQCW